MMREFDKQWMAARAWYTAGRLVEWSCPRCGGAGPNIYDKCTAALEDPCPAFVRTEEIHAEFKRDWRTIIGADSP